MPGAVSIRNFRSADRETVREISCQTAFLENPPGKIFGDKEILADALTLYYTDFEPESCFVAEADNRVIGYLTGAKDSGRMNKIFNAWILPRLFLKSLVRGVFFKKINLRFFTAAAAAFFEGEFAAPDFSREYPAVLHINILAGYRGRQTGRDLVERYLAYLREAGIRGVHFGSMSEKAKGFFLKLGFSVLHTGKRSYLKAYFKQDVPYYIFGKKLTQ